MKASKPFDCTDCTRSFRKAVGLADHRQNVHGIEPVCDQIPAVSCDYCGAPAILTSGAVIYPGRTDLSHKQMYRCVPCGAWVGCHPGTIKPLGRLANAQLRRAKQDAHEAFDPLWTAKMKREQVSKGRARGMAYQWLAAEMGIPEADCHIGMFTVAQCRRVVDICSLFPIRSAA